MKNNLKIKPTLCIYHGNCADGFTAAWAVWKKYPDIKFFAAKHGGEVPDCKGEDVLFVDFSYKRPVILDLAESVANSVTILDHHKSAVEELGDLIERGVVAGRFDMNRSGAGLAWEWFHDEQPPELLLHVEDRDLWRFAMHGSDDIATAMFSFDYNFKTWDALMADPEMVTNLRTQGQILNAKLMKDIRELLRETMCFMVIGGHKVPVINIPYTMASEAGNIMAKEMPEYPFAATYYDRPDTRRFSVRSIGDFDVSAIAKAYGGGGHKNAAGFEMPHGWRGEAA